MVEERAKRDPLEREQETPDRQMVRLVMGDVKTYTPVSVRRPMDVDHDVIGRAQEPTRLSKKEHPFRMLTKNGRRSMSHGSPANKMKEASITLRNTFHHSDS